MQVISEDPVIKKFIRDWDTYVSSGRGLHANNWGGYDKSMFVIYRMARYLAMSASIENLRNACNSDKDTPTQGHSFTHNAIIDEAKEINTYEYIKKDKTLLEFFKKPELNFCLDISKHAVISQPWHNNNNESRVANYSLLVGIRESQA